MVSLDALVEDYEFDVASPHETVDADTEAMLDAINDLPGDLPKLVRTYIGTGNIDRAAAELGLPRSKARGDLAKAKSILTKSGVQNDSQYEEK